MSEPITAMIAAIKAMEISTVVTTVAGAAGAAASGIAAATSMASAAAAAHVGVQQAELQGKLAERNAAHLEDAAKSEVKAGEKDSDRLRQKAARLIGKQKVAMAQNGIDVNSSSALDLLDDTRTLSEEDAFAIREASVDDATGALRQAANYQAEASMTDLNKASSIITGVAKVADRWAAWQDYRAEA